MEKTTVAHLMAEKLADQGVNISFTEDVSGDIIKEHDWMMTNPEGPMLMTNHSKLFQEVCADVDKRINEGTMIFHDDGTITIL
jgi:hypothetical protein